MSTNEQQAAGTSLILSPQQERALQLREMRDGMTPGAKPIAIVPRTFGEAQAICEAICLSQIVPKQYQNRPQDMIVVVMSGAEIGLPPMAALRLYHVIEGVPRLSAEGIRGIILQAPECEYFEFTESSEARSTWVSKRRGRPEKSVTWTIERAKRAQLLGKQNWQKDPEAMLNARCSMQLGRMEWPNIISGLISREEALDGDAIDVTWTETPQRAFSAPAPQVVARSAYVPAEPAPERPQQVEVEVAPPPKRGPGRPPKAKEESPGAKLEAAVATADAARSKLDSAIDAARGKESAAPQVDRLGQPLAAVPADPPLAPPASEPSTSTDSVSVEPPTPVATSSGASPAGDGFADEDPEDKADNKEQFKRDFGAWLKSLKSKDQANAEARSWIARAQQMFPPLAAATTGLDSQGKEIKVPPRHQPEYSALGAAYAKVKEGLR